LQASRSATLFRALSGAFPCESFDLPTILSWQAAGVDLLAWECSQASGCWPAEDVSIRNTAARDAAAGEVLAAHFLALALGEAASARVPVLLMKGAALAYAHYPQPWCRPYADVDILVPPGTIEQIRRLLRPLGYRPAIEVTSRHITGQWHLHPAMPGARSLDVHERLVNPRAFDSLPSFADLFSRSVALRTAGGRQGTVDAPLGPTARTLSAIDTAWHLLVHAAAHHHGEDRLLDQIDLWLVTRAFSDDDWRTLEDLARASHTAAVCAAGLTRLHACVNTSVPADVIARLEQVRGERSAAFAAGQLTVLQVEWSNFVALGLKDRIAFVIAHLLPPQSLVREPGDRAWMVPWRYVQRVWRGVSAWRTPGTWRRRDSSRWEC
jgi:hypothetical protein